MQKAEQNTLVPKLANQACHNAFISLTSLPFAKKQVTAKRILCNKFF
jgi:hypothetical protein